MASTAAIVTVTKMLKSLPEAVQEQVVEHLREYLAELEDERKWDNAFQRKQSQLVATACRAKREIAQGQAQPLDYDQL